MVNKTKNVYMIYIVHKPQYSISPFIGDTHEPLYGETLEEAKQILEDRKRVYPFLKDLTFKIMKVPLDIVDTYYPDDWNDRKKKSSKPKPKRKIVKKKSCGCK